MKYIKEEFNSIRKMLGVIERRPNNTVMRNEHSSDRDDYGFTHTHSYNEARGLLLNGWDGCLNEIKTALKAIQAGGTADRRKVTTGVVGYAPHVPNAILGVPNSMIMTEQKPKKQKVISILFDSTENAGTEANELAKADIEYTGRYQLDASSLDRFALVEVGYSHNIDEAMAQGDDELCEFAKEFRKATSRCGVRCLCTYRAIERIAKLKELFEELADVLKMALLKGLGQDDIRIVCREMDMDGNPYYDAMEQLI